MSMSKLKQSNILNINYEIRYQIGLKIIELENLMKRSLASKNILMYVYLYTSFDDNTIVFHTDFTPKIDGILGGLYIPEIVWDCNLHRVREFEPLDKEMFSDPFSYYLKKAKSDTRKILKRDNIIIYPPIYKGK